jgi:glycosyltransferase involved in cell wall biosynthesis
MFLSKRERKLHVALGFPEWQPFEQAMRGQAADATYVIQKVLARGLTRRGHFLLFVARNNLDDFVFTKDAGECQIGQRSWSAMPLFEWTSKLVWHVQRRLHIPYLNIFSNFRFFDAAVQNLEKIDIIYERNGLFNAGLAMAAKSLHLPYVIFFEADQIMELDLLEKPLTGLLRWRAEQLLRYNLRTAHCIVCVSEVGRRHLIDRWNVPADKTIVFPNAVDADQFKPDQMARMQIRESLNLGQSPAIIFVGNFYQWHDVDTLLKAFAEVLKIHPEARLILVGDGENRERMIETARTLNLTSAVHFTGIVPHSEVPRYMAAADIAVVPYPSMQQEIWLSPLKLFEYMSSEIAIVASAVDPVTNVLRDGVDGLLVPPGDVNRMACALIKLIKNPDLRSSLGKQARQEAIQNYSWENYLSRLECIFWAVIEKKPLDSI